jgi:hypothetical protein
VDSTFDWSQKRDKILSHTHTPKHSTLIECKLYVPAEQMGEGQIGDLRMRQLPKETTMENPKHIWVGQPHQHLHAK